MNKYVCALLLFGILCLAGCSLPVNKNSDKSEKTQTEPTVKKQINENAAKKLQTENAGLSKLPDNGLLNIADNKAKEIKKTNDGKIRITLYYQDTEGLIVPATREIPKQEGIAKAAVNALIDSSINREELEYFGIYPVLPLGTEVIGLNIRQGTATIDFNDRLLEYKDAGAEKNIIASIVYTLTEFNTIDNVKILVKGQNLEKLKFDTDIAKPLNRENVLVNALKANLSTDCEKVDLYLFKQFNKDMFALPISVEYISSGEDDVPAKIIELSEKEYFGGKVQSQLPQGTRVNKSSVLGNTLILDFNSNFKNYGGTAREDAILKQLQYSMKQIKGIERIKILIEGEEAILPEGTEVKSGLSVGSEMNYINEE